MVAAGLVVGLATGGFPQDLSPIIQQAALIVAMSFSLTGISLHGISPKVELRGIVMSFAMSYGALGGIIVMYGLLTADPLIRSGWILMASAPPAIAVVPITSLLRGDVRRALIANAVLYFLALVAVPGLNLLFLGRTVPVDVLAFQTLLLIGIPVVLSRALRVWKPVQEARPALVSVAFFFLVLAIAGSTRGTLLGRPDLVAGLSLLAFLRTIGLGLVILAVAGLLHLPREGRIAAVTFAGFKNLGLTVVLAFTVFGPLASLPAIVSLIFEATWMALLPLLFRVPGNGVAEIAG